MIKISGGSSRKKWFENPQKILKILPMILRVRFGETVGKILRIFPIFAENASILLAV